MRSAVSAILVISVLAIVLICVLPASAQCEPIRFGSIKLACEHSENPLLTVSISVRSLACFITRIGDCDGPTVFHSPPAPCGPSGMSCPSGQGCYNGQCCSPSQACRAPWSTPADPVLVCTDLNTDMYHCGKCDNYCNPAYSVCDRGACCFKGLTNCGGECVDLARDPENCGTCGNMCLGEQSVCVDRGGYGQCSCPGEYIDGTIHYGSLCYGQCTQTYNNPNNCGWCGIRCDLDEYCDGSWCMCSDPKMTPCPHPDIPNPRCYNLKTDPNNCGECFRVCAAGASCEDGKCECPAIPGQSDPERKLQPCKGKCMDLRFDEKNCGGCGYQCPENTWCDIGGCVCTPPRIWCNGKCILPRFDNTNCGHCGNVCPIGATCKDYICECPHGMIDCMGRCTDTDKDNNNCGNCGNTCKPGYSCIFGFCCIGGMFWPPICD